MNQIQVFIILNVLPILILAISWLLYLKSENKKPLRKMAIITFTVFILLETLGSVFVHKVLFDVRPCPRTAWAKRHVVPSALHRLFKVDDIPYPEKC